MSKFIVDNKELHQRLGKLCPCIISTPETEANEALMCPCRSFLVSGKCVCGLFVKYEGPSDTKGDTGLFVEVDKND